MEVEFEEFFQSLSNLKNLSEKEIEDVLKPLKFHFWIEWLKKFAKVLVLVASICFAIYYVDTLNWYFCAIGRILLIKILPLWDWRYLANSKCLIGKSSSEKVFKESENFNVKDCRGCEHFDHIVVLSKTSFSTINDKFLIRGLPVIVSDAVKNRDDSQTLSSFVDNIYANMSDMINADACNFETNLMMSQYAKLDRAMGILRKWMEDGEEMSPWFISFRNCRQKALKASRLLLPKPYFYPTNLQAPYTSWLLMSQKYENYRNELEVYGLVIITQIKGSLKITLQINQNCREVCKDLSVKLFSGESLVFLAHMWKLSYEYIADDPYSATLITETNLN